MTKTIQQVLGAKNLIGLIQGVVNGVPADLLPQGMLTPTVTAEGNRGSYTKVEGMHWGGPATFVDLHPNDGCIDDDHVAAAAGLQQSKLEHQHRKAWGQLNAAATTETRVLHTVYGATGTILAFEAGSIAVAVGDATVTLDLKKNGTTVLSAVITLDNANTIRVAEAGTISVPALVDGDVLEVVITATIGTGTLPTGVFCELTLKEDAT